MVLYDYCTFLCMNFFRPMREYFLGYSASKFRGKDKLFSTSPFGNVVPCAASRLLVSILFYTAPINYTVKYWIPKHFLALYTV